MRPFKIGDIVIIQNMQRQDILMYNGEEGTIIALHPKGFRHRDPLTNKTQITSEPVFGVHVSDGNRLGLTPFNMRHKEPPKEVTDWAVKSVRNMLNKIPQSSREPALV